MSFKMAGNSVRLDLDWINAVRINSRAVEDRIEHLSQARLLSDECKAGWLLRAVTCIDLTTLAGDDTQSNVQRLCRKGCNPIKQEILDELGFSKSLTAAAICVYPNLVRHCVRALERYDRERNVQIASVAAGFPSGQFPLESRLTEIKEAYRAGATEIDVVINRGLALNGDWKEIYHELVEMRQVCGKVTMKCILGVGELGTLDNVYKASLVAMMAGSDFIKTSTGKESVNATLPVGLVMIRAIKDFKRRTGNKIGFKAAGGIRTFRDVLAWQVLVKEELGDEWLHPSLFRIGASALLSDIERELFTVAFKRSPIKGELPIA